MPKSVLFTKSTVKKVIAKIEKELSGVAPFVSVYQTISRAGDNRTPDPNRDIIIHLDWSSEPYLHPSVREDSRKIVFRINQFDNLDKILKKVRKEAKNV